MILKKRKRNHLQVSRPASAAINLLFILLAVACIYPVLLTLGVSFTSEASLIEHGYKMIPEEFSNVAYKVIIGTNGGIVDAYKLTIFTTITGAILSLTVTALYAYPLSRRDFTSRNVFAFIAFFTMLFSGGLVPWYIICTQYLHLNNTLWALILPHLFSAWNMIVLRTFFSTSIPFEIIESAKIDGAGEWRIFGTIVLPLSKAGLATIGLFVTLSYWNDYYLSMMLTSKDSLATLQYYLQKMFLNIQLLKSGQLGAAAEAALAGTEMPSESTRMAMCILAMGPIVIVYPFFQKYFVQGMTVGSVKG